MKIGNISEYKWGYNDFSSDDGNVIITIKNEQNGNQVIHYFAVCGDDICDIDNDDIDIHLFVPPVNREQHLPQYDLFEPLKVKKLTINRNETPDSNRRVAHFNQINRMSFVDDYFEVFKAKGDENNRSIFIENEYLRAYITRMYSKDTFPIFADFGDEIMGPFIVEEELSDGWLRVSKFMGSVQIPFGVYALTDDLYIEFEANDVWRKFVMQPTYEKLSEVYTHSDFRSIEEIERRLLGELKQRGEIYKPEIAEHLIKLIKDLSTQANDSLSSKELERIAKASDATEKFINQLTLYLTPERERLEIELASKEEALESKIEELKNIEDDISIKSAKIKEEYDAEIEDKKLQKEALDEEIKILEAEKENIIKNELAAKQEELDEIKREYERYDKNKKELESQIEGLQDNFTNEQIKANKVLTKLVEHKTHFDFLSGKDFTKRTDENTNLIKRYDAIELLKYTDLRDALQKRLRANNRDFENHFIDNLVISVHQNMLTIFAGLPGTGKTSLARILCNALVSNDRVREVSVGRGWTSQKDLIGFQNPLNNKFYAAHTGVYSLLSKLDAEHKNNIFKENPMSFVILDEANLSPMEHYWSTFYSLTDSVATDNMPLTIGLGQDKSIRYNNTLRFVGTINSDQTTEELSHRILDRANIIRIKPKDDIQNIGLMSSAESLKELNISFEKCIEFFKLSDFTNETTEIAMPERYISCYSEIKRIFHETLKIYISPRIDIAIRRYCFVAKELMSVLRALDYATAQRLLPLINTQYKKGKLDELKNLFEKIEGELKSESISLGIINEIIEKGDESEGGFNYFMTLSNV